MHIHLHSSDARYYVAFVVSHAMTQGVVTHGVVHRNQSSTPQQHWHDVISAIPLFNQHDDRFTYHVHITTPTRTSHDDQRDNTSIYLLVVMQCDHATAAAHAVHVYQALNTHGTWHVVDDIATLIREIPSFDASHASHATDTYLDDVFCAVHADTVRIAQEHTPQIMYQPFVHESVPAPTHHTPTTLMHGSGVSLWITGNTSPSQLWRIGLAPAFAQHMYDAPISTLLPWLTAQPTHGVNHTAPTTATYDWSTRTLFDSWVNTYQNPTLRDVVQRYIHERQIGMPHIHAYTHQPSHDIDQLVAMHMHHSFHETGWRDIAITDIFVMVLDNHNRMWVWNNQYQALAVYAEDVCAMTTLSGDAKTPHCGFFLTNAGQVWRVTTAGQEHIGALADTSITHICSNGVHVLAIDAKGQGHIITAQGNLLTDNFYGMPRVLPSFRCIALGKSHLIALDNDHGCHVWSENRFEAVANNLPVGLDAATIVTLVAGDGCSFALDIHGIVHAWGDYQSLVSTASLQHMNAHGVRQISCHNGDFICHTAHSIWHNNEMYHFPATVDPASIIKVVRSTPGVWAAIRRHDALHTLMHWSTQSLTVLPGIHQDTADALNAVGIHTLYDVSQWNDEQLRRLAYFHLHHDALLHLYTQFQTLLDAYAITHEWPIKAITITCVAPHTRMLGWYTTSFFMQHPPSTIWSKREQVYHHTYDHTHEHMLIPQSITNIRVDTLDLSTRAHNSLRRAEIETIGQLLQLTVEELVSIRNLGHRSIDELREKIRELFFRNGLSPKGHWNIETQIPIDPTTTSRSSRPTTTSTSSRPTTSKQQSIREVLWERSIRSGTNISELRSTREIMWERNILKAPPYRDDLAKIRKK